MSISEHSGVAFVSKQSAAEGRNVYVWSTQTRSLIRTSWKVSEQQPMTISQMYHYLRLAWKDSVANALPRPYYNIEGLCRIDIERCGPVLQYDVVPTGPVLPDDSTELVKPGDHFAFCDANGDIIDDEFYTFTFLRLKNYVQNLDKVIEHNPDITSRTAMTVEMKSAVLRRDRMRCSVTGVPLHNDDARVVWIMPPELCCLLGTDHKVRSDVWIAFKTNNITDESVYKNLMVPQNCLTMHRDFVQAFQENKISFDVDDGYKTIHFNLPPNLDVSRIQPSLHFLDADSPVNERYLRSHFSRCLLEAMAGGDVKDDMRLTEITRFLFDHEIHSARAIKRSNNIWRDMDIGRLVLTWFKGCEPDDSGGNDSSDDGSDIDESDSDSDSGTDSNSYYEQLVCEDY
ncbi:hypothetical protein DXG03_003947 [Asterophora parasitica]|uniref:HNH nuclease domain-containing protein n=1 Tax=Asterophora parasitica TaxID=117018 RepID=A0A9P7G7K9_9AGAR|nr:hypothetical protein DXG03_003947 [Asterophora parasitica]